MTIIAIVSYYEIKSSFILLSRSIKLEVNIYFLTVAIGHVPVKYPVFSTSVLFIYFMCEDLT